MRVTMVFCFRSGMVEINCQVFFREGTYGMYSSNLRMGFIPGNIFGCFMKNVCEIIQISQQLQFKKRRWTDTKIEYVVVEFENP